MLPEECDLLIRGAKVRTSSGWLVTDLAVRNDRVIELGACHHRPRQVIDATGLLAVPGFVDFHNHSDQRLLQLRDERRRNLGLSDEVRRNHNFIHQGVTTIVTGNCGEGIDDVDEWRHLFACAGFGTNVCHFVPYGSLRKRLFGDASASQRLDLAELDGIDRAIDEQLEKGAYGLSIAFDTAPQCFVTTRELVQHCRVVAERGGIYLTHIRHECGRAMLEAVKEAIEVGERSGVAVHLSQLRLYRSSDSIAPSQVLDTLSAARERGVRITASQNPYTTVGGVLGAYFVAHLLSNLRPEEPPQPPTAATLPAALAAVCAAIGPENMLLTRYAVVPSYEGKTIKQLSVELERSPAQLLEELYHSQVAFLVMNVFSEDAVEALMQGEFVFTSSNGEVASPDEQRMHPRSFGAFIRKLAMYARDKRLMSLERAIDSMTSGPAKFLGLPGRGEIQRGSYADLVLLDPEALDDRMDYLDPCRYPRGIEHVIVNGRPSLESVAEPAGRFLVHGAVSGSAPS